MTSEEKIITVSEQGIVKVKGIAICRRLRTPDGIVLQVKPHSKNCKAARRLGDKLPVISLQEFVRAVTEN